MNKECVHILLLNKRMLNLAIIFKLTTAFTSSKHFAVNFEYQLDRFDSDEGGSPRSFDQPPSLI